LPTQFKSILENALSTAMTIDRPAARCQTLNGIAETWLSAGDKAHGLDIIAEALKTADLLKHPDEKAKHLAWAARLLKEAGDIGQANEQFKRSHNLACASESVPQKVNALYYLASEYLDAGLPAGAKAILIELEPLVINTASGVDTVCELINIAEIYADMDDDTGKAGTLIKAVHSARSLKDVWFKAERLIEIAEIYNGGGNHDEAAGLIQEALNEVERIEESNRSFFWLKLSDVYVNLNLKAQAVDCLQKAQRAILKSDDLYSASGDVLKLAEGYLNAGDRSASRDLLEKARTIIDDLSDNQDRIIRLLESAGMYIKLEKNQQALDLADIIYQLNTSVSDNKTRLYTLAELAILYVNLNNTDKAGGLVNEIIGIAAAAKTRTSGLGAIAEDLVAAGDSGLALKLAEIIREPEIKAGVLIAVAGNYR
jgi:tetratricopeptide (TPR) repeat protein